MFVSVSLSPKTSFKPTLPGQVPSIDIVKVEPTGVRKIDLAFNVRHKEQYIKLKTIPGNLVDGT